MILGPGNASDQILRRNSVGSELKQVNVIKVGQESSEAKGGGD